MKRISLVKQTYVACGRDTLLATSLTRFLEFILADNNGQRDPGRIFFITGESGARKSRAIAKMLGDDDGLKPELTAYGVIRPSISVTVDGGCTLGILGQMIMDEAGYPTEKRIPPAQLWNELPRFLQHRGVVIVHIDETQHMVKDTEKSSERKGLAKALKGVMNNISWPVSFIVSGTPELTEVARLDEQFERRLYKVIRLSDIDMQAGERELVVKIIKSMAETAQLDPAEALRNDMPDRIAHAAKYRYGRTTQVVLSAIHDAFTNRSNSLGRDNFAHAYLEQFDSRANMNMNPFVNDEWRNLPPGTFIIPQKFR